MGDEQRTDEAATLIDEVDVAGYKVKAWSIDKISKLSGNMERIYFGLKERGVSFVVKDATGNTVIAPDLLSKMDKIIFSVLPEASHMIAITLGISIDKTEEIPQDKAVQILIVMLTQNVAYLKNWLGLPVATIKSIIA